MVSLLLAFNDPLPLSFLVKVGDFFVEEEDEDVIFLLPEALVSFDAVAAAVSVLLGLAFTARSNTGENCGETSGEEEESGRPD